MVAAAAAAGVTIAWRRRSSAPADVLLLRWGAVVAVAVLAALAGPDPLLSTMGDTVRLFGAATAVVLFGGFVVGAASGSAGARRGAVALVLGGAVVVGDGLIRLVIHGWSSRAISTLGNADFLGAYLALLLPIALGVAIAGGGRASRALARLTFVIGLVLLVNTRTRGAWIGAATGIALLAALWLHRRGRLRVAGAAALVVCVSGLTGVAALTVNVGSRGPGHLDLSSGTGRGRLDTWANTLPAVAQRPALGWGPEGFRRAFGHVVDDGWVRNYSLDQIPDRAHNRFLDVAVTTGIPGLAADAALLLGVLAVARVALRRAAGEQWWAVAAISAGLAAWLVQGLFLFDTFDIAIVAWVLAGTLAASAGAPDATGGRDLRPLLAAACAAVVLLVAVPGIVADHRVVHAGHGRTAKAAVNELIAAIHLRPRALDTYLLVADVGVRSRDVAVLERAHRALVGWLDVDVQLADADVLSRLGRLSRDGARLDESVRTYQRVLAGAPANGLAWLGLGETFVRAQNLNAAEPALRSAMNLLPHSPYPAMDLALFSLSVRRDADACRYLRKAEMIAPRQPELTDLRGRVTAVTTCGK